ncbi:hypothetical protein GCM10022223_37710 [Kineosporia mesophila]|uniref:Uncharacterized protein n=1 Tax=Kineosporia mesophila TaxID=566012 RepID=A0ABP6ZU58_9ACTN
MIVRPVLRIRPGKWCDGRSGNVRQAIIYGGSEIFAVDRVTPVAWWVTGDAGTAPDRVRGAA